MPTSGHPYAYIISARRSALGRIGGLHQRRRLEDLAAPVIEAALADAGLEPARVDELIVGNATQGGNPARLIAFAAGLPEATGALTIDRQCASGLDAILSGARSIASGDATVVVAGGAESLSTAPWRIARPRRLHQTPHFIGLDSEENPTETATSFEAAEMLSRRLGITREQQDAWTFETHASARAASDARAFVGEIVAMRANADEVRDEISFDASDLDDLADVPPYLDPDGTLTPANTSALHDGSAFVVMVDHETWDGLGRPPALKVLSSSSSGVSPGDEAAAPIEAMRKLYGRLDGINPKDIGCFELSETSAAQAIAFSTVVGIEAGKINLAGGALVRGHPFGAAGAVLVVRLFTTMVRTTTPGVTEKRAARRLRAGAGAGATPSGDNGASQPRPRYGIAVLGARGGLGLAALFEGVGPDP